MVQFTAQKRILLRALKENPVPFLLEQDALVWQGATKVTSRQTNRTYDIIINISLQPNKWTKNEVIACVCKAEGVRFEDLVIVHMLDPKILGTIRLTGLPKKDEAHEFSKFMKKAAEESTK